MSLDDVLSAGTGLTNSLFCRLGFWRKKLTHCCCIEISPLLCPCLSLCYLQPVLFCSCPLIVSCVLLNERKKERKKYLHILLLREAYTFLLSKISFFFAQRLSYFSIKVPDKMSLLSAFRNEAFQFKIYDSNVLCFERKVTNFRKQLIYCCHLTEKY